MPPTGAPHGSTLAWKVRLAAAATIACLAPTADPPVTLLRMNLSEMIERAGSIFRGTVVSIESGSVSAGGVMLLTADYSFLVEQAFRGDFPSIAGERLFTVRTIGKMVPVSSGGAVHVPALPDMPRMEKGHSYLLFTTTPGPTGLSTTVGLEQGCFQIIVQGGEERALNGFGNLGLFAGMDRDLGSGEPVSYGRLADLIRAEAAGR